MKLTCLSVFLFTVLELSSCSSITSGVIDPKFAAHEAAVLASPRSDAIVGMWYNHFQSGRYSTSGTMLFNSDGTGFSRVKMRGFDSDYGTTDKNFPLSWKYDGCGWWTAIHASAGGYPNVTARYRTDGKVLLYYAETAGVRSRQVWVRADDTTAVSAERGQP
jgi:hypothetical protein